MIVGLAGKARSGKSTVTRMLVEQTGERPVVVRRFAAGLKRLCAEQLVLAGYGSSQANQMVDGGLKDEAFDCRFDLQRHWDEFGAALAGLAYKSRIRGERLWVAMGYLEEMVGCETPAFQTPRAMLQYVATDMVRQHFGQDFWAQAALSSLRRDVTSGAVASEAIAVFDDMRFPNERVALRAHAADSGQGCLLALVARDSLDTAFSSAADAHASENSLGSADEYDLTFAVRSGDFDGLRAASCAILEGCR